MNDDLHGVMKHVDDALKTTDGVIEPYRKSAFRRFPTLFTLLVGFGAGATFFGVERLIADIPALYERPWLIIVLGIGVLIVTGRLHKKLD